MPTATPPPPPAIAYPPPPPPPPTTPAAPPATHKVPNQKIAAIGVASVAVIGGVVALVSLLGHHKSDVPTPGPVPIASQSPSIPGPSESPAPQPSTTPSTEPSTAPSTQPGQPSSGGSAVDLGNGVSVAPAAGWKDAGSASSGQAAFISPDGNVEFFVATGPAGSADVQQVLQTDINHQVQSSGLSGVQVGTLDTGDTGSQVFDKYALLPFKATASTQQGTAQITGLFGELLNTQSSLSAFVLVQSLDPGSLKADLDDVNTMIGSVLGG